jgi:glutathione S-transferase
MLRLYTFAISHFSEKARWALDLNRVPYEERRLLPGPHMAVIRRRAARTTVPVLEHDGKNIQGSSAILDYLEERLKAKKLAPPESAAKRSAELEALADRAFGLGTQRIFYATLLDHKPEVVGLWTQGAPWWSGPLLRTIYPLLDRGVRRTYKIRPDKIEESKDLWRRTIDETDRVLASSPYLTGDALTRADVTVASLLAPMCRPPEHLLRWPAEMPPELGTFLAEFEGRPTWEFVRRMYREHRTAPS